MKDNEDMDKLHLSYYYDRINIGGYDKTEKRILKKHQVFNRECMNKVKTKQTVYIEQKTRLHMRSRFFMLQSKDLGL